jgi:hypothetical protein
MTTGASTSQLTLAVRLRGGSAAQLGVRRRPPFCHAVGGVVDWSTRAPARHDAGWVSGQWVSWEQSAIVWRDEVTAGDPGRDHRD